MMGVMRWGTKESKDGNGRGDVTYNDSVPSVVRRRGNPRLPQLWLFANGTTAPHAARMMRCDHTRKDGLFDAPPEAPSQHERAKDDRGRHE